MVISPKVTATVEKVDGNNAALPGAEFTLYTKALQAEATHAVVGGKMVAVGDVAEGATVTAYVKAVGSAQATAYNDDQTKALTIYRFGCSERILGSRDEGSERIFSE